MLATMPAATWIATSARNHGAREGIGIPPTVIPWATEAATAHAVTALSKGAFAIHKSPVGPVLSPAQDEVTGEQSALGPTASVHATPARAIRRSRRAQFPKPRTHWCGDPGCRNSASPPGGAPARHAPRRAPTTPPNTPATTAVTTVRSVYPRGRRRTSTERNAAIGNFVGAPRRQTETESAEIQASRPSRRLSAGDVAIVTRAISP